MKTIRRSPIAVALAGLVLLVGRPAHANFPTYTTLKSPYTAIYALLAPHSASLVVDEMNQQRAAYGLAPLKVGAELTQAADVHAADEAANSYSDHTGTDGSNPQQRMMRAGYNGTWYGENIGYSWATGGSPWEDADMMVWWMNSPGHRANILNPNFKEVGVAVVDRVIGATTYRYWVVDFGAR